MPLDFSRCRYPPFRHQAEDAERLVRYPIIFNTSEMRVGKSKITIDAAQFLFEQKVIDRVIVVAPSPVRDVWFDKTLGELRKHLWLETSAIVMEYHQRTRGWNWGPEGNKQLQWIVTNYEYLRSDEHRRHLYPYCTPRTLIVGDESSYLKNHTAAQTEAFSDLRWRCGRVVLLNGTPISHSPLDLFSQGNILHPHILDCRYITHYKSRYAQQQVVKKKNGEVLLSPKGREIRVITGWVNLEDIQRRFAPYVIRRLQKDCLDLPPKLDPVTMTAEMTPTTWKLYKEMRDDLVIFFENNTVATARQAAIKTLRLRQMTSGFVGGVEDLGLDEDQVLPGFFESLDLGTGMHPEGSVTVPAALPVPRGVHPVHEIGREKLDVLLWFIGQRLDENPNAHMVVWCAHRWELARMMREVSAKFPQMEIGQIHGDQKPADRQWAMKLLHPETSPSDRPVFVGGTYGTGSFGVNFTAANISVNLSFDFSLGKFLQSKDRVYGPGQVSPVAYFDVVATGPKGQRTIDHHIVESRRNNENIAEWTSQAWVSKLKDE